MKITIPSQECIDLIKHFESFEPKAYLCPAGIPTIGYGSTLYADGRKVKLGETITEVEALTLLMKTLNGLSSQVDSFTTDSVTQCQFDALVDFAYNCGAGNLKSSTLIKKVNLNPNDPDIRQEFEKWVYADGKKLNGLILRRRAEAALYFRK